MADATVVMVGQLRPELAVRLEHDHNARHLDQLDVGEAATTRVAVTSGMWGVRAEHLDRLPSLEAVVNFGAGTDTTDLAEAGRRGVVVAHTPDVLTDCVADTAVGLLIDVMRGISAADRFVRRGEWEAGHIRPLTRRVSGARVGIVGLGRIGLAIARRLEGFGATVGYHNRRARTEVPYTYLPDVRSLAKASDVLVLAASGGAGSHHLVDAAALDALGPNGFLVNVARGSTVDEIALVAALEAGGIAGAGLDVFAAEPHVPAALLGRDDVVLLPHVGSATVQTRQAMADLVLANVSEFLTRGRLLTPVV